MPKRKAHNARRPAKKKTPEVNIHSGQVFTDMRKKKWVVGDAVARGGCGSIYEAKAVGRASNDEFIVKVEPLTNGSLFCEIHFYLRAKGRQSADEFARLHELSHLAMPVIQGCGQGSDYRFLVMERYGDNLAERRMSRANILRMSIQLVYTLQYIHRIGYTHNDVKITNLVLSRTDPSRLYLIDFGLANRYCSESGHIRYAIRPTCTHEGTLEYTSIDAHMGVRGSRRSDLEILFYNIVDWLSDGRLPWKAHASDPNKVESMKKTVKRNPEEFLRATLKEALKVECAGELAKFARYVYALTYEEEPDYDVCRSHLLKILGVLEPNGRRFDGLLSLPLDHRDGNDNNSAVSEPMDSASDSCRNIARPLRRSTRIRNAAVQTEFALNRRN